MDATISMESQWKMIQSRSTENKQWLLDKLVEDLQEEEEYISKEEILAGIDAGLKDLKAGRTRDFKDFMKEWENEL